MTALLLAALLAQALPQAPGPAPQARPAPEKFVLVARPQEPKSSLWRKAKALARRLWEKPDPVVAAGNAKAAQSDAQGALDDYDRAREKHPDDGALAHDRATALLKLGAEKAPEALSEAARALDQGDASVKPLAAYDQAYALEQLGKPEEAMAAYARALAFDPDDKDAKVNLELLLKGQEQQKQQQSSQGKPKDDQKKQQQGDDKDKQQQAGKDEQKKQDEQAGEKEKKEKEQQQQQQGKPQEQQQAEKKDQPKPGDEKPVDRSEAQRLLDALKAGEKNLQVWRFAKQKDKNQRRGDAQKDW